MHEIGHNLDLHHDDYCNCPFYHCIMNSRDIPHPSNTVGWSDCSFNQFNFSKNQPFASCILMPPDENEPSYCGDGVVQSDEQCDCGPKSVSCQCCNAQTCTLTSNAVCGSGPCCNLTTCNYTEASSQTVCRKAVDYACDFDEYCNGESRFCPEDRTIHDGVRCSFDGFCYKGKCGSPDAHCSYLYQADLKKGDLPCFASYTRYVNPCGFEEISVHNRTGILCDYKDIECGRLSCEFNGTILLKKS